jgi:hypothetical protein
MCLVHTEIFHLLFNRCHAQRGKSHPPSINLDVSGPHSEGYGSRVPATARRGLTKRGLPGAYRPQVPVLEKAEAPDRADGSVGANEDVGVALRRTAPLSATAEARSILPQEVSLCLLA